VLTLQLAERSPSHEVLHPLEGKAAVDEGGAGARKRMHARHHESRARLHDR
jgi:hypothetical protein